jgi:hypothetical protein
MKAVGLVELANINGNARLDVVLTPAELAGHTYKIASHKTPPTHATMIGLNTLWSGESRRSFTLWPPAIPTVTAKWTLPTPRCTRGLIG